MEEINMKIKHVIMSLGLVLVTGAAGLFCLSNKTSSEPMIEAKADTTTENTTIYVEVCSAWHEFDAAARIYAPSLAASFIKPNTIKTATADHNALYSFTVPAGVSSFYIYRMDKDNADSTGGVWNSTALINYSSSYNYYNVTSLNGSDCPYTPGWMNVFQRYAANHQDFRLTIINENYDWFKDNAKTVLRFWDGTEIDFSRFICFKDSAIYTNTLTCSTQTNTSSPAIYAAGFNIFRKSSDGSITYTQTGNWTFTYENKDMNAFVIKAKNGGDAEFYNGEGQSKVIGAEYNAMAYGIFFLETTKTICYGKEEDNNYDALSAVWNKLNGAANASTNGNNLLKTSEEIAAFQSSTEYYTHDAYLRYAHIVGKYPSLDNYLDISGSLTNKTIIGDSSNTYIFVIVIASIVTISVAGASLLFIKRKRETH